MIESQPFPQTGRRSSSCDAKSPEFEFWMLRNPINLPPPNLLSADQLFSGGFLLPLHLLNLSNPPPPPQIVSDRASDPEPSTVSESAAVSKRWRSMFSRGDKKHFDSSVGETERSSKEKDSVRKRDKRINGAASAAELNINIWPFARSRSAGNRPRPAAATKRKVSSAPCSRSNSTGDSKSRKWPNSPSRAGGVHLGRSSPVWQVRRGSGAARGSEAVVRNTGRKDGGEARRKTAVARGSKGRVLSLNVPMCIGYRNNLSCKSEENNSARIAGGGRGRQGDGDGESVRRSNLFNLRSLFTKKVY